MKKSNINININKDDHNINDYLHCWSEIGERPNRITIYNQYKSDLFISYINTKIIDNNGIFSEYIPTDTDYIINEKKLVKIDNTIFISYINYDIKNENSIIGDVTIIFSNNDITKIDRIIEEFEEFVVDPIDITNDSLYNTINIGTSGIEIEPIDALEGDYDNIDLYYNDDVLKSANKVSKYIRRNKKGLTIIYGERGTGKTSLVNYMIEKASKISIFIPCNMIESTINSPDFKNFLNRYKDSILVIDDSEIYFSELYTKSNIFTNNILQLVDGFQSDSFNINIITILNVGSHSDIDHSLIECNNLVDVIEIGKLDIKKSKELSSHLGRKVKVKNPMKIIDIMKNRNFISNNEIGF